jgi:hypothetical protein
MRNKIFLIFILGSLFSGFKPNWKQIAFIDIQVKIMEVDYLGNLYLVSKTNQLYKYNQKGELLSTLNYSYLGNISHLDCSNPMELFLFYRELNTIVFLDNNLAFRGKINLSELSNIQAITIGRAYDNGIWLFDLSDLQLKKVERDGKITQQSGNSLQFVDRNKLSPSSIRDNGNQVFLNDSASGILVFDAFANYLRTIPIKGRLGFSVNEKELSFLDGKNLIRYGLYNKAKDTLQLPDKEILQAKLFKQYVYLTDSNQLRIYSFE